MNELSCLLEGILFASGEPVYAHKLMQVLGVDAETAAEDACRIEHVISDTTFNAIRAHYHAKQAEEQPEQV